MKRQATSADRRGSELVHMEKQRMLMSSGMDAPTTTKAAGLWTGTSYESEVLQLLRVPGSANVTDGRWQL